MPSPTPKEKFTVGVYVTILTAVILIIWGFFLKHELKIDKPQISEVNIWQSVSDDFKDFQLSSQEGLKTFKNGVAALKGSNIQVEPELAESFAQLAQEELFKKRTADWKTWFYNDFSLSYPSDWEIEPSEAELILFFKEEENILIRVTVNFLDNLSSLSALEWWESTQIQDLEILPFTEFDIDGQAAIKITLSNQEIIYFPYSSWMTEVDIDFFEANDELFQQVNDLINSINIS